VWTLITVKVLTLKWGGIEGLKAGRSKFILCAAGENTNVRLRHFGLPEPACRDAQDLRIVVSPADTAP
jgi:hypothetical protein